MKQSAVQEVSLIILLLIFFLGVLPTSSTYALSIAEGYVSDCVGNEQNKQECKEGKAPVTEPNSDGEDFRRNSMGLYKNDIRFSFCRRVIIWSSKIRESQKSTV